MNPFAAPGRPATPSTNSSRAKTQYGYAQPTGHGCAKLSTRFQIVWATAWGADADRYCPALPEPLITATAGLRAKTISRDAYDTGSPPAAPTSSNAKTARTPTGTSGYPARLSAITPR